MFVIIINDNYIYKIRKLPYETDENTYRRGWFIIKNYNSYDYEELISRSIIYLNECKNKMKY
jgi:hypothetical protein